MSNQAQSHRELALLMAAALAVAIPVSAGDQQATEEKPQQATAAQATAEHAATVQPTPKPALGNAVPAERNSLAAAAARIRLQHPEQGGGGEVVISNENLRQVAATGNVSVAGGVAGGDGAGTAPATAGAGGDQQGAVNPASALVSEYLAQKRTVDGLKERLANFDKQLAQPATDPHYSQYQNTPQNRAPGVVDQAQKQRDDLAKQLADEQAKLEAIRERARREGVELSSAK